MALLLCVYRVVCYLSPSLNCRPGPDRNRLVVFITGVWFTFPETKGEHSFAQLYERSAIND